MTPPAVPETAPEPNAPAGAFGGASSGPAPTTPSSAEIAAMPLPIATMEVLGSMLDNVEETERARSAMAAVQAMQIDQSRRMADLACHPVTSDGMRGWSPAETARRTIISELACRLRIPEITAENLIAESKTLVNKLPRTWAALMDGRFTYRHAQVIIDGTWSVKPELVAEFETTILPFAQKLTVSRLRAKSRTIRERLDTASIATRHEAAKNDRHIELDPVEDGMAWLHLYVEAPVAVAMYQKATEAARSLQGPNETRTLAQLRADVLATMILAGGIGDADSAADTAGDAARDDEVLDTDARVTAVDGEPAPDPGDAEPDDLFSNSTNNGDTSEGESSVAPGAEATTTPSSDTGCPPAHANPFAHIRPRVAIMVPALSLLGLSNEPATLEGYGPIDLETARRLVGNATSFTRILTHPETGTILSVGRDKYRVPKALKRWLELRDQTCTKPGCGAPAYLCDLDHIEEWQHGGESSVQNLAHLCKKHHTEIHHTGWKHERTPTGIEWTSPTGRKFSSPLALDISTG